MPPTGNKKILSFYRSNNWSDFKNHLKKFSEKEKGDLFEILTKHFLKIHPTYATKLKHVWLLKEVPSSIRSFLNLPGPDEGIDLIAETKEKEYWAIQCKYREDEARSLSRKDIDTFTGLAFVICKNISLGLVCTTADRFSHRLKKYGDRLSFCSGDIWRSLDEDFFQRIQFSLKGKVQLPNPTKPRPHQVRAVRNAHLHFQIEGNSRGKLISACGTGKSLTGYWIADNLKAKTILVAVPSLALIKQTLSVWTKESLARKREINWICVCSDETVGDIERDDMVMFAQDLGIRIHTNSKEIANWLRESEKGTTIVFTTYQSGRAIAEASRLAQKTFDLGIQDEAHKTVGKKDTLFSHLLFDENIRIKKRLFMTATERSYQGQSDEILSMDDPDIYGDTFELLSFKEALESTPPLLSDYKIITILITQTEIAQLIRRNLLVRPDKGKWDKDVEAEMLASVIALRKAIRRHGIKHGISFHASIARAKAFKETQEVFNRFFPEYKKLDVFHVSGKMPTAQRSRLIDDFKQSRRALITNARCLSEGVDIPDIDCVLFADPRKSTIDIVQAVGRALRMSTSKKFGYVIIPVIQDTNEPDVNSLKSESYDHLLMTLRALASNDDRIVEYFRTISQGKRPGRNEYPVEIDIPFGRKVDSKFFAESIKLKLWSRLAKLSWRPFEEARAFVHSLTLKSQTEWRKYYKGQIPGKNKLPEDIPLASDQIYKDKGWKGWGDWLGTWTVATREREYRSFKEARAFAHNLNLKNGSEWRKYCQGQLPGKTKLPEDIPTNPNATYKDKGWKGMGDWLGTGSVANQQRKFRFFKEARVFVHKLNLKSQNEWRKYCQGQLPEKKKLPIDIPASPYQPYKNQGWRSWGDWLGTGTVATRERVYRSFKEARAFVHKHNLKSVTEWKKYCQGQLSEKKKLPIDIPANPNATYKDKGWRNWGNWLGTGAVSNQQREYRSFKEARVFVHKLNLKNVTEWRKYCQGQLPEKKKLPEDIPKKPSRSYKDKEWKGMEDWLGTGTIAPKNREFRSFKEAHAFVNKLNLKNVTEWRKYCQGQLPEKKKLPKDIPVAPNAIYKDKGWKGMGDWLGTGSISNQQRKYRSFKEARSFVQRLSLKSNSEWRKYCKGKLPEKKKLPEDIPATPDRIYKDKGWKGMGNWLGTGTIAWRDRKIRPFKEARAFVRRLDLKSVTEWRNYCKGQLKRKKKLPSNIPAYPNETYKDKGWRNWGDWLGTGTIAPTDREFRSFKEARAFVQQLGLKSGTEWWRYCKGELLNKKKLPEDIPSNPKRNYKDKGWKGMGDWLGTGTVATRERVYRSFKEARAFVHSLNLKNQNEWRKYCQGQIPGKKMLPEDIPANPNRTYKEKGWEGIGDWLGTGTIASRLRKYRRFKEARAFVRSLNLKSQSEWKKYYKGQLPGRPPRPMDIPTNPNTTYKEKGWKGTGDWLGKS